MGPQLSVSLWHIASAPNQHSIKHLLRTPIPKVEGLGIGISMPQNPALSP